LKLNLLGKLPSTAVFELLTFSSSPPSVYPIPSKV
jgi:hypothetical protein